MAKMTNEKMCAIQYLRGVAGQPISVEYVSDCRLKVFAGGRGITNNINTLLDRKVTLKTKGVYVDGSGFNKARHVIENVNAVMAKIDGINYSENYLFNTDYINDITKRKAPRFY